MEWERLCTVEFARRTYEDTEAIMRIIHSAAGLDEADLRRSGHSYTISNVEKLPGEDDHETPCEGKRG